MSARLQSLLGDGRLFGGGRQCIGGRAGIGGVSSGLGGAGVRKRIA